MGRVVVTGIGIISALGTGVNEFWENAVAGCDAITQIERFDASYYRTSMGGEIKNFFPVLKRLDASSFGLAAVYAAGAARMAYEDAAAEEIEDIGSAGVFMGTNMGDCDEVKNADGIMKFPAVNIVSAVCRELGISGETAMMPNACAAGNYGIIGAYEKICSGKIKYAFAGGAEALLETAYLGFSKLRALSPEKCRPFDKNRSGMAIGEGAAVLFMESLDSAIERGAHIYAEVIGWGASCDAFNMVVPRSDGSGIRRAMSEAIASAGISPDEVDYICAHGTGSQANDSAEAAAINSVFDHRVAVSSLKSMIGHAMGAASAIEAAACCLAVYSGIIPPTINFETPDELCDIDCVPNKARHTRVRAAANNASAFGGNNTCVIFREVRLW